MYGPGSSVGIATSWTVRGSNPGGAWFSARPDLPWGAPSLLYNGYRVFPGGKVWPGRVADHLLPSSAADMEESSYTSTHPLSHNKACNGNTLRYFVCTTTLNWQNVRTDINIPDTDRTFVSTGNIVETHASSASATLLEWQRQKKMCKLRATGPSSDWIIFTAAPSTCSYSLWNLLHVIRLAPKILT